MDSKDLLSWSELSWNYVHDQAHKESKMQPLVFPGLFFFLLHNFLFASAVHLYLRRKISPHLCHQCVRLRLWIQWTHAEGIFMIYVFFVF